MNENTGTLAATCIVGIGIGALLCTVSRRRRERHLARRQLQLETESLRRDLESLRSDIHRLLQPRSNASADPVPKGL